jgi:flagellar hook capping protein FlgD
VDALSATDAWAAGSTADATETFTIHWDGAAWSIMPSPSPSTFRPQNFITGLAAIAHDDVWGVGSYNSSGGGGTGLPTVQTLAMHWDGSRWSVAPSPAIVGGSSFSAVSALASNDVWAVGQESFSPNPAMKPLAAHWDGSGWKAVEAPFVGNRINQLLGVSARAPGDVWAVGTWRSTTTTFHILILHWNGSAWSVTPAADPGNNDELLAAAAVSANDAWAVGDRHDPVGDTQQPLIMHWNGSAWSTYPLAPFPGDFARLNAIRAASPTGIWAAGAFATVSGGPSEALLMHWDGTSWSEVATGPTGGSSEYFNGLAVGGECDAWAVGSYVSGGPTVPLTDRLHSASSVPGGASGAAGSGALLSLETAPNPALGEAHISMVLARGTPIRAEVFDVRGRMVWRLDEPVAPAGSVTVAWDGRDDAGAAAAPGLYFIRVSAGSEARAARLVLRR